MLIGFDVDDGKRLYVNPDYVLWVHAHGADQALIALVGLASFILDHPLAIVIEKLISGQAR
jgi:hypothetical protein